MKEIWDKIISSLRERPRDIHTIPLVKPDKRWFYAEVDESSIKITSAKHHTPYSTITSPRRLRYSECEEIYAIYIRRQRGEKVSAEARKLTNNQVYWYGVFNECLDLEDTVILSDSKQQYIVSDQPNSKVEKISCSISNDLSSSMYIKVANYMFKFIEEIRPLCNENGEIKKFYPQGEYNNKKDLLLSDYGKGAFCKFNIKYSEDAGVYLWVVGEDIIYIGETNNFNRRFNQGYGCISPRNCYEGGQNTNCKMNKVVLEQLYSRS